MLHCYRGPSYPTNTRHSPNVGLMLADSWVNVSCLLGSDGCRIKFSSFVPFLLILKINVQNIQSCAANERPIIGQSLSDQMHLVQDPCRDSKFLTGGHGSLYFFIAIFSVSLDPWEIRLTCLLCKIPRKKKLLTLLYASRTNFVPKIYFPIFFHRNNVLKISI